MRTAAVLSALLMSLGISSPTLSGQRGANVPEVTAEDTYFTIHNLRQAHTLTLGEGARVGILDHSFGMASHPELYAGGHDFLEDSPPGFGGPETHKGYWMALALKEIAPEAEIYALNTHHPEERIRVQAMIRALDWAVAHGLDAVTYCSSAFSEAAREALDPAVMRAIEAGVVVVFANYSHPLNILPSGIGEELGEGQRTPDLDIFSYECAVAFADEYLTLLNPDDDRIPRYRPSLSRPSAGPVTAGFVALLRSLDPNVSPRQIKRVLLETSRPMMRDGSPSLRVPDAFAALKRLPGSPLTP